MGVSETLMAQCIAGVMWALFAAQPMVIQSATGPVLVFEASLYVVCQQMHIDVLTMRVHTRIAWTWNPWNE